MSGAIDNERWRQAGALFHELVELDESSRSERLSRVGDSDPALRDAVEALLAGDAIADERLPSPGFGLGAPAARNHADPLRLEGEMLARFRVLERVASGGMGVVYRAEDTQLARTVALKFPLLDRELGESARTRILREARAAGALDHPNLCPIYEIGESDAGPFFAMPLYRGETLKQRLARTGPLAAPEALGILAQLAAGIGCAHAAGIVHRDMKPGNIMLLPDGTVRVLDFGLALAATADRSASRGLLGTVYYMAPEQIRGERVDARADLWALGIILYEMLTGVRPFAADTEAATLHAILHAEPRPLREIDPAIPSALDALVRALIAKDPAARVQTASDLERELAAMDRGNGGALPSTARRTHARRPHPRRTRRLVVAGGTVLAAALSGVLWSRSGTTLIDRGVLSPRDTLVLADFEVAGPDSTLSRALTLLLRRDFADSKKVVTLMPSADVSSALRRMRQPVDARLTPELAREVATREGARAVVTGALEPLRSGYLVALRLVAAESGEELASVSATAPDPERDLLPAIASVGEALRRRIGESLRGVPGTSAPRRRVTTTSLAALRLLYSARALMPAEGIAAAREAVALDSTFAYAWMSIGNQLSGLGYRNAVQDSAFTMAYRLREQLTLMERAQVTAMYWKEVWRDRARALTILQAALAQDTTIWQAVPMNIADWLVKTRQFERGESFARRIEQWKNIGWRALYFLAEAQAAQGKYAAAEATVATLQSADGADSLMFLAAARALAVSQLRYEAAESLVTRSLRVSGGRDIDAQFERVTVLRLQGRLAEASRAQSRLDSIRASVASAAGARFVPGSIIALDLARENLWLRASPARAVAHLDSLTLMLGAARDIGDRILAARAAALYAAAGRPARARTLLDAATRGADTVGQRALYEDRQAALAEIALAEGRFRDAMERFRASDLGADALPASACSACILPHLARVSERAGWADSARMFWERYVTEPAIDRARTDQWFLATAYRTLGAAHAASGDSATAASYRQNLARLWKNADKDVKATHAAIDP